MGLRPKNCWTGAAWDGLRGGCGLEVCGCGAGVGKISQIPVGAGGLNFAGAGREVTKNFNPCRTLLLW